MNCSYEFIGVCLRQAPESAGLAIFGFAEFLTALALLVLVFNSSDFLYKFRISVAALPIARVTFGATLVIGMGTLLTDLWFAERWYAPAWGVSRATIQALFGALFLGTVLLWIWIAFIRPPRFSSRNFRHYYSALYHALIRGSEAQLSVIAAEIMYSASSIVRLSRKVGLHPRRGVEDVRGRRALVADYARDTLVMIGNRKLCRHVVSASPATAIVLMEEMRTQRRLDVPLGEFARNVTAEAILNRDSILYHENALYNLDVVGRNQPFSRAMYGDYELVESLGHGSHTPLDIDWRIAWDLTGDQFEAYCRIVLLTFRSYIDGGHYWQHSYALTRAFSIIENAGRDLYKFEDAPPDSYFTEPSKRLRAAVEFVDEILRYIAGKEDLQLPARKNRENELGTIFDRIAELMFELILSVSAVRKPADRAWTFHHNIVWGKFFGLRRESKAWSVVRSKLFRLLFNEIKEMEMWPNFKGARILGVLLNVGGLKLGDRRKGYGRQEFALRKVVLDWTEKNFMRLHAANPEIAEYAILGSISFDAENRRLVKTYAKGTEREPHREYLNLSEAEGLLGQ